MRMIFALPLLLAAGCNVQNDPANDQVTLQYNEEQAGNIAEDAGNTAENIGEAIVNEAEDAVNTAQNTDVDVDTNENASGNTQ
ncbi:MAG TPA: hypothetical protein VFU80_09030 [Sphingomicrobium sp.]|nr:hypothetical protein [Sphingomicrobium sp.]